MIKVVAAVIFVKDKILCFQRGKNKYNYASYKYEFPGGKIKPGETEKEALKRELLEELELKVTIEKKIISTTHTYPDFSVKVNFYKCFTNSFNGKMKEHINFKLLDPKQLSKLDWLDADLPLIDHLTKIK